MICLSRDELIELSGYKMPSKISVWLRNNGLKHFIGADGWPRVLRDPSFSTGNTLTKSVPNVAALKELQDGKAKKATTRPS